LAVKFKIQNSEFKIQNPKLEEEIKKTRRSWKDALENFKFNESLKSVWDLISFCDKYIEKEKPWQKSKNQQEVISNLLFTLKEISDLLNPFLPKTSEKILKQIETKKPEILFPKL
jgi:methionyl-tRNA synthetase